MYHPKRPVEYQQPLPSRSCFRWRALLDPTLNPDVVSCGLLPLQVPQRSGRLGLTRVVASSLCRCLSEVEVQHNQIAKLSVLQGALSGAISLRTLVAQPNPFDAIDEVCISNAGHEY